MAGEKFQKKGKEKWKEKVWYTVEAPPYLGSKEVSVALGEDSNSMVNRVVEVPISELTGNFKKSNEKALFRITNCEGTKCKTIFIGHYIGDDYIRRLVRRRKERIDIIEDVKTSDNSIITVKIVVVTDGKVTNTKKFQIRKVLTDFILNKGLSLPYSEFVRYLIGDDIYNDMISATKDIYPLKKIEVRKSELVSLSGISEIHAGSQNSGEEPVVQN
ncbi:ribosomal protein small subunit S1 [Thermoplasma volcanium GSS1]|uniref:Small ribosomal subunit protein eS1 n=1 Tax=Thermoplasma volcanium (strain ATCC 51530 / DSM 4299 / JCM 9571 / NBRC 15438 / GSS1) TaxID=273116 RepID=RS3A_THEVO|nr:30S ribosomal protein S3ae [Thermoplasma volcanium]Q978Z2.1 RecName: Full=Small ribosomal subunit protein eS1; AltName: Full=30S ribosomal protein S3Ae; AltName: Full=Ribosomal protein S1e [Thermoplasma volcanium GSS1]BAB60412.1 ribosomal protein small subunit S1 [Thermoplasma volcanium GSS1]